MEGTYNSITENTRSDENYQIRKYEKPYFKKEEVMNFPLEMINSLGKGVVCRQCSSCHGCR